jgi:hypothetical protein
VLVLVGDRGKIVEALRKVQGLPDAVEVDAEGMPVK